MGGGNYIYICSKIKSHIMRQFILIFIAVAYTLLAISQQTWKEKFDEFNQQHYDYVDKEDWRSVVSAMDKMHKMMNIIHSCAYRP